MILEIALGILAAIVIFRLIPVAIPLAKLTLWMALIGAIIVTLITLFFYPSIMLIGIPLALGIVVCHWMLTFEFPKKRKPDDQKSR